MTIETNGMDMSGALAHDLERLNAYRDGRIAGSRHAQRSRAAAGPDTLLMTAFGRADWRSERPEWLLGFCDSLAAYEISC